MATDYKKLNVDDIRNLIVEDSMGTIDSDSVRLIKGKNKLIAVHKGLVEEEEEEENGKLIDGNIISDKIEHKIEYEIPAYCSEQWPEFVMSKFNKSELIPDKKGNLNPSLTGLRRVAQSLLGNIVNCGPIQVWPAIESDAPGRATVLYEVVFDWQIQFSEQDMRSFKAVASSWYGNTDPELAVYPEAMAESRAEGRALRKALAITNVCAEELTNIDTGAVIESYIEKSNSEFSEDGVIQDTQKTVIEKMCKRLNLDTHKFINSGNSGKTYTEIEQISRSTASKMIQRLNQYQTYGADSVEIPDSIKL